MKAITGRRWRTWMPVVGTVRSTRSNWLRWLTVMFAICSSSGDEESGRHRTYAAPGACAVT